MAIRLVSSRTVEVEITSHRFKFSVLNYLRMLTVLNKSNKIKYIIAKN